MTVLDNKLQRNTSDGHIMPMQFYDETSDSMLVVSATTPLPVNVADAEIQVAIEVNVDDIVTVKQTTHDDLNCNANIQFGNADISSSTPLPVNLEVGNTAVSNTNPVPIIERKTNVAPAASPITVDTTAGGTTICAENANRLRITIQNTGTEPCIVRLGGNPTTSAYNFILFTDTSARKGEGGSWTCDKYYGAIKGLTEANSTTIAVTEEVSA